MSPALSGLVLAVPGTPGPLLLVEQDGALSRVVFPGDPVPDYAARETPLLLDAASQFREFLSGARTRFKLPFRLDGTPFQRSVWNALLAIPFGETRTYGDIARAIDRPRAFQAVGSAVGTNPLGILVPCHRILPASGALGGFRTGPAWKRFLLRLEGHSPC